MTHDQQYRRALLTAALDYATRGWHVFPLRPGSKKPATPNHPAHLCDHTDPKCEQGHTGWEQRATTNPDRITQAWTTRPYGIGIATGPSGLVVIDLDTPTDPDHLDGAARLAEIEHRAQQHLPATRTVATPSGGRHLYYNAPPGSVLGNTTSRLGPHIDTRANGGYVVAPPTQLNPTSPPYTTLDDIHPLPTLPPWLTALLTQLAPPGKPSGRPARPHRPVFETGPRGRRYAEAALAGETARVAAAPLGMRNQTLFTAAVALGQLVATGLLTTEHATDALTDAATGHIGINDFTPTEAARTIASGLARGQHEPRTLPTNLTELEPTT